MDTTKEELIKEYFSLGTKLEETYPHLNFKNHCYWRIALDNVFSSKWDAKLQRPAYKNLDFAHLKQVVQLLQAYCLDKELLLKHNLHSLNYRKSRKTKGA